MDATLMTPCGPIKVGQRVTYRTFMGATRTGIIVAIDEDIKNSRPGFDMKLDNPIRADDDGLVWGYADQVVRRPA